MATLDEIYADLIKSIDSKSVNDIATHLKKLFNVKYTIVDSNYVDDKARFILENDRYSVFGTTVNSGEVGENALRYCIDTLQRRDPSGERFKDVLGNLRTILSEKLRSRRWLKCEFSGDLGERLSQYAALLGTSKKLGIRAIVDTALWSRLENLAGDENSGDVYLSKIFDSLPHVALDNLNGYNTLELKEDDNFARRYMNIVLPDDNNSIFNVLIRGKFQAQDYWMNDPELRKHIIETLRPQPDYLNDIARKYSITTSTAFVMDESDTTSKNTFAKLVPECKNFLVIPKDAPQLEKLAIMIMCPLGGVADNSILGWWGLVLNLGKDADKLLVHQSNDIDLVKGREFVTPGVGVATSTKTRAFVLNLAHRQDRMKEFGSRSSFANIDTILSVERFEATNGRELLSEWSAYLDHLFRYSAEYPKTNPYRYHNKSPGELGCAHSHFRMWQKIAAECPPNDVVVVLEDDVEFGVNFVERFDVLREYLLQHVNDFDVCFLGTHDDVEGYDDILVGELSREYNSHITLKRFNPSPPKTRVNGGGTYGYVITRRGAQNFLKFVESFGIPQAIDWFMFEMMKLNVSYKCAPHLVFSPIYGKTTTDSDVQNMIMNPAPTPAPQSSSIKVRPVGQWGPSSKIVEEWSKIGRNGTWGNIILTSDENCDVTCLINYPQHGSRITTPLSKTIVYHMEPRFLTSTFGELANPSDEKFLSVQTHDRAHNNIEWHVSPSFDDFINESVNLEKKPSSSGTELSTVLSNQYSWPGHKLRIDFVKYLRSKGVLIDVYGKSADVFNPHMGELPNHCKDKALFSYKYTFNAENFAEKNYFTEKLTDGILSECVTFYWGCPNVSDYIPEEAFIRLPLENFEESYNILTSSIRNDEWSKRIGVIREAKFKILTQLSFMPTLDSILVNKGIYSNDNKIRESLRKALDYRSSGEFAMAFNECINSILLYSQSTDEDISYQRYHLLGIIGWYANKKLSGRAASKIAYEQMHKDVDKRNYDFYSS
jgi:GR25 family glycosyltransferase involved in LPS biosynthesis